MTVKDICGEDVGGVECRREAEGDLRGRRGSGEPAVLIFLGKWCWREAVDIESGMGGIAAIIEEDDTLRGGSGLIEC